MSSIDDRSGAPADFDWDDEELETKLFDDGVVASQPAHSESKVATSASAGSDFDWDEDELATTVPTPLGPQAIRPQVTQSSATLGGLAIHEFVNELLNGVSPSPSPTLNSCDHNAESAPAEPALACDDGELVTQFFDDRGPVLALKNTPDVSTPQSALALRIRAHFYRLDLLSRFYDYLKEKRAAVLSWLRSFRGGLG